MLFSPSPQQAFWSTMDPCHPDFLKYHVFVFIPIFGVPGTISTDLPNVVVLSIDTFFLYLVLKDFICYQHWSNLYSC